MNTRPPSKSCPGHHFVYNADRTYKQCVHCPATVPGRKRRRPPQERKR